MDAGVQAASFHANLRPVPFLSFIRGFACDRNFSQLRVRLICLKNFLNYLVFGSRRNESKSSENVFLFNEKSTINTGKFLGSDI